MHQAKKEPSLNRNIDLGHLFKKQQPDTYSVLHYIKWGNQLFA